jgi:antitoxin ParD1/3/4
MATTSLSLGGHWEEFIRNEITSGRYSSASDVVRDALRELEDRGKRLEALRTHLAEGAELAAKNDFIEGFDIRDVVSRAKSRI